MFARRRASAVPTSSGSEAAPSAEQSPRRDFLARAAAAVGGGLLALAGQPALPRGSQARAATSGADPFVGEIMLFAGNFAPNGWAMCNGQILSIAQNTALFSLLGTTYGGNGQTTFALPDLRGRAPIHFGQGPGLPDFLQGESAGEYVHTLALGEMPGHSHVMYGGDANGTQSSPAGGLPARDPSGSPAYGTSANTSLSAAAIGVAGSSQPHNNMPPYLAINYCIALQGIFPSRS